jgi:CheY-like chemotaxis protein
LLHILVVDDEPLLVKLNKRQLENCGYKVDVAIDGSDAIKMISAVPGKYDLIVTDLAMPNLTGRQLIRKVVEIDPQLPIIVFTGMMDDGVKEELEGLGVRSIVEKPVVEKELIDAVKNVLGAG